MNKQIQFKTPSSKLISMIFSILVICFAVVSISFATWQAPTSTPPASNVPPPLNVSSVTQGKEGNLGVGSSDTTNFPTGKTLRITDTANNPELQLQYGTGNNHWSIYNDKTADDLRIWSFNGSDTASDNRLTILQNGNVGIGTTTPVGKLKIAGQIKITGGTPGAGEVLTSDANGLATWVAPSTGCNGLGGPFVPSTINLTAAAGNAQVTLSWSAPISTGGSAITHYILYRSTSPAAENLVSSGGCSGLGNVLNCTDTGLTNGQIYYYKVLAHNAVGDGLLSNEASATPAGVPVSAPTLAADGGNAQVVLHWTVPTLNGGSAITSYKLYRGTISTGKALVTSGGCSALGNVFTCTDAGLTNGQIYYYAVLAHNAVGDGPLSNEASATPATVPSAPTLTATAGNAQVVLNWAPAPANGGSAIIVYKLYRGTFANGEGATAIATTDSGTTTFTNTGLTNGTTYYYKVSAINALGEGDKSNEASATPVSVPSAPTLTATASIITDSTYQVNLSWTVPTSNGGSAITGYKVYRGTTPGGEGATAIATPGNGTTTYTDTGLTRGTTYYYKVSAINAVGEGPQSNEAFVTTPSATLRVSSIQCIVGGIATATNGCNPVGFTMGFTDNSNGGSPITSHKFYRGTTTSSQTLPNNYYPYTYTPLYGDLFAEQPYNGYPYFDDYNSSDNNWFTTITTGHWCYQMSAVNAVGEGPRSPYTCEPWPMIPNG